MDLQRLISCIVQKSRNQTHPNVEHKIKITIQYQINHIPLNNKYNHTLKMESESSNLAFFLFTFELYHLVGHIVVLLGLRLLPRRDLVRQRLYFLTDLLTVHLSFWVHRRWWGLILLQNIQHAFYFITWDKR